MRFQSTFTHQSSPHNGTRAPLGEGVCVLQDHPLPLSLSRDLPIIYFHIRCHVTLFDAAHAFFSP